jgi:hypothetical protein
LALGSSYELRYTASSEESIKDGLSTVLSAFTTKWNKPGDKSNIKPLNVILFTDGKRGKSGRVCLPQLVFLIIFEIDGGVLNASLNAMIQRTAERLDYLHAPPSSAGIQFVVMGGGISFQPVKKSYVNGVVSLPCAS